jgi:phosphatidylglycerol:prolipoprotein diacylglycerol transferase
MVPYIHIPDLGFIHPFGLLVATGVIIGTWLATRRARKIGFDVDRLNSFITWMLLCGFAGGHMLDEIFYHPKELVKDPIKLIRLWDGLSSFGGFAGALIGILLWKFYEAHKVRELKTKSQPLALVIGLAVAGALYGFLTKTELLDSVLGDRALLGRAGISLVVGYSIRQALLDDGIPIYRIIRREKPVSILAFADLILSVFPVAWIFGRSGCASVHDHPGALAPKGAFLAVEYVRGMPADASADMVARSFTGPKSNLGPIEFLHGDLPRWDLGFLELVFTIVLAAAFALTWRRRVPTGTYVVATALCYAPVRFAMDYLRITDGVNADPRYGTLTPAQWSCVALFTFGIAMIFVIRRNLARGLDPARFVLREGVTFDEPVAKPEPPAETAA